MQNNILNTKKKRFGYIELSLLQLLWRDSEFSGKQIELAEMFGTRKQIVNQAIKRLRDAGLIRTRKMLHTRCKKITLVEGGQNG